MFVLDRPAIAFIGLLLLAACSREPAPAAPPPPPPAATVWDLAPPAPTAWASIDVAALRHDERFAPLVELVGSEADGELEAAPARADRVLVYATDAFFTDRVYVLAGSWDTDALGAALQGPSNATGGAMERSEAGAGTLYSRGDAPWAVALIDGAVLATGPVSVLEPALSSGRRGTVGPDDGDAAVHARWTPPSLVRGALADRVGRPELAEPLRSLVELDVQVTIAAGVDLALVARFEDAAAAAAGHAAIAALVAIAATELPPDVLADATDGLTLETRDTEVRAWWEFDRAAVQRAIDALTPLLTDAPSTAP